MVNTPSKSDDERKALDDLTVLQHVEQADLGAKQFQGIQTVDQTDAHDKVLVQTIVRGAQSEPMEQAAAPGSGQTGMIQPEALARPDIPTRKSEPPAIGDSGAVDEPLREDIAQLEQAGLVSQESARTAHGPPPAMPNFGVGEQPHAQQPVSTQADTAQSAAPQPEAHATQATASSASTTDVVAGRQTAIDGRTSTPLAEGQTAVAAPTPTEQSDPASGTVGGQAGQGTTGIEDSARSPSSAQFLEGTPAQLFETSTRIVPAHEEITPEHPLQEPKVVAAGHEEQPPVQAELGPAQEAAPAQGVAALEHPEHTSPPEHPEHPSQEPQGVAAGHDEQPPAQIEHGPTHDAASAQEAQAEPAQGAEAHDDAGRHGGFGNNGLGNGLDEPPPGMPDANPNADTAFDAQGDFTKGAGRQDAEAAPGQDSAEREHPARPDHPSHEPQGVAAGHEEQPPAQAEHGPAHDASPAHEAQAEPTQGAEVHDDAGRHGGFGNNGLGNGLDEPPPGMPDANPNADTAFEAQGDFIKGAGRGLGGAESTEQQQVGHDPDAGHGSKHADMASPTPAPQASAGLSGSAHADLLTSMDSGAGHGPAAGGWTEMVQSPAPAAAPSGLSHGDWTSMVEHEPPKSVGGGGGKGARAADSSPSPAPALDAFSDSSHDNHKGHDV